MQVSDLPLIMIRSLCITLIIEILIAFIFKYRHKDLIYVLLVNIMTNPLLNSITVYINYYYGLKARNISLIILEIGALLVEGVIYQKYLDNRKINGYLLSLILNIFSFTVGIIINNIF